MSRDSYGTDEIGNFAIAQRDLETGQERVLIVTPLPVSRQRILDLAYQMDADLLAIDPSSDVRHFVTRLDEDEVPAAGS